MAELEKEARAAQPPHETGDFRQPDLVELIKLDPTIKLDIRYATTNNFLSTPMYSQARAFLQRPAADKKIFVANPAEGSRHNRGCAVDLTLYDLKTGAPVKMPSGYDEMTERAYSDYTGGTPEERERRAILRQAMEKEGFTVFPQEWWHFDYKGWRQYPILNVRFEDLSLKN